MWVAIDYINVERADPYYGTRWFRQAQRTMLGAGPGYLPVSAILAIVEETDDGSNS